MHKILFSLFSILFLTSCSERCSITGISDVPSIDGKILYIKVIENGNLRSIDSCKVIHGKFIFTCPVDSVVMAELFMNDQSIMPFVLEENDLNIKINKVEQSVCGGPLNEKLYNFLKKKSQLENEFHDLTRSNMNFILHGMQSKNKQRKIKEKANKICILIHKLETDFIVENYKNVLGPTAFMFICNDCRYPVITDQIDFIISNAPTDFLSNTYVKEYIRKAKINMKHLNSRQRQKIFEMHLQVSN